MRRLFFVLILGMIPIYGMQEKPHKKRKFAEQKAVSEQNSYWSSLPAELKSHILSYVLDRGSLKEFTNLQTLNTEFKELTTDQAFLNEFAARIARYGPARAQKLLLESSKRGNIAFTKALSQASDSMKRSAEELLRNVIVGPFEGFKNRTENNKIIETLLLSQVNPNAQDSYGETPLMKAQQPEIAKLLIAHGAFVNARNNKGETALLQAIPLGLMRELIKQGADVNIPDNNGNTALMLRSLDNRPETIKLLLNNNALVNIKNKIGGTALMIAASEGHEDIANLLIEHGAH